MLPASTIDDALHSAGQANNNGGTTIRSVTALNYHANN
jgi:hypothetical protein